MRRVIGGGGRQAARLVALCLGVVLCASGASASGITLHDRYCRHERTHFAGRGDFLGINDIELGGSDPVYQLCTTGWYAASHLGLYRAPLLWSTVQPARGPYNWSTYDREMTALALHHIQWLPVLVQVPPFAAALGVTSVPLKGLSPPRSAGAFARFAAAAVARYGRRGSFWRQYPKLPRDPVRAWQIWNEPNISTYWVPRPKPGAYLRLLRASYRAIRHLDGHADVVSAGMPYSSQQIPAAAFLRDILRGGAAHYLTLVALHPYAPTPGAAFTRVREIRTVLDRYGARRRGLWLTEWGWASGGPRSAYTARGVSAQRRYIDQFIRLVVASRSRVRIRGLVYYGWRDRPPLDGKYDFWGLHTGLLRLGGSTKPALGTVAAWARRLDG